MLILSRNIARNINTCLNSHLSFRTDAYAEDLLGASTGTNALVAARDTKFEALIPPLHTGTGTAGFTNTRDVLVLVVTAVVLMAVRQARADDAGVHPKISESLGKVLNPFHI